MIEPIKILSATKIIKETETKGNSPLLVVCNDLNRYYVKTTNKNVPRVELINEIICSQLLKVWGLSVPELALVKIDKDVLSAFIEEGGTLSKKYDSYTFDDYFIGFQEITPVFEFDAYYYNISSKKEWNAFQNPLDLLKIGVFDAWVCNMDRTKNNPNILLFSDPEGFKFIPIDNAASFAYASHYNNLNSAMMNLGDNNLILNHPFVKSISKFATPENIKNLEKEIISNISDCCSKIESIFNLVPGHWGFSSKARMKLETILCDKERNVVTSRRYITFMKK